jgi:hypothetical protein
LLSVVNGKRVSKLLSDFVRRLLGGKLPAGVQVKVLAESADTCYLVLPANPDRAPAGQLADQQLEAVAGGAWTAQSDCASCEPIKGEFRWLTRRLAESLNCN